MWDDNGRHWCEKSDETPTIVPDMVMAAPILFGPSLTAATLSIGWRGCFWLVEAKLRSSLIKPYDLPT